MKSKKPDVLYAPIGFNTAAFFKQLRQAGIQIPTFESDNLNEEIIKAAEGSVEGVYQTQSANPEGPAYAQFVEQFEKKYHRQPSMPLYSAWGYDAVQLVAQAIRKVGIDPKAINQELYHVKNYSGASGIVSISEEGSSRVLVKMYQVREGKLVSAER